MTEVVSEPIRILRLRAWSMNQHYHHLRTSWKRSLLGPSPNLLNQNLYFKDIPHDLNPWERLKNADVSQYIIYHNKAAAEKQMATVRFLVIKD